jgi:hypothetical protein
MFFQSLATVKKSQYITDGGETIGAGERTSVYVRWLESASQIALFRLSVEKLQFAETLLDDYINSDLRVPCVHTILVGLHTAFIFQLFTVERLNNIKWCII